MKDPWSTWLRKGGISPRDMRVQVKRLEDQMGALGQDFGIRRARLPDGTRVKVMINKNGVVPVYRVIQRGGEEQAVSGSCRIESGLAMVVDGYLLIYAGTDLASYFIGDGTSFPWDTASTQHIHGEASLINESCNDKGYHPVFTGAPTLDVNNAYTSIATSAAIVGWANDADRAPSRYTGLIRLMAQAKGPHFDIATLIPDGWPALTPTGYALMREANATTSMMDYWLVYCGTEGVKAVKLTIEPTGNCIAAALYAGTLTGTDAVRAESFVLACLRLSSSATAYELLTASDLAGAHDGRAPVAHGWHFSPQKFGTASEAETDAYILTVAPLYDGGGDVYWNTRVCHVTLTLGGTPSAAFSVVSSGTVCPNGLSHIWKWSDSSQKYIHLFTAAGKDLSTDSGGPVYLVYNDSGVKILNYIADYATGVEYEYNRDKYSAYLHGIGNCGSGGTRSTRGYTQTCYERESGFDWTGTARTYIRGRWIDSTMVVSSSGGGTDEGYFSSINIGLVVQVNTGTIHRGAPGESCGPGAAPDVDGMRGCKVVVSYSTMIVDVSVIEIHAANAYAANTILITADPTVLFYGGSVNTQEIQSDHREHGSYGNKCTSAQLIPDIDVDPIQCTSGYENALAFGTNDGGSQSYAWGAYGSRVVFDRNNNGVTSDPVTYTGTVNFSTAPKTATTDYTETEIKEMEFNILHNGAVISIGSGWSSFVPGHPAYNPDLTEIYLAWYNLLYPTPVLGSYVPTSGPQGLASYDHNLVYQAIPSGGFMSQDGYDADAADASVFFRFMGFE